MLVASPHSSSSRWMPLASAVQGASSSGVLKLNASKQRMDGNKRKRSLDVNYMEDCNSAQEEGKRQRRYEEALLIASHPFYPTTKEENIYNCRPIYQPPTTDEKSAWTSSHQDVDSHSQSITASPMDVESKNTINSLQTSDTLWMGIEGDVEMRESKSQQSSFEKEEYIFPPSMLMLKINTPTGHPHPYSHDEREFAVDASGCFYKQRCQLGASYFTFRQS